jgi:hypothetical protein
LTLIKIKDKLNNINIVIIKEARFRMKTLKIIKAKINIKTIKCKILITLIRT